MTLENESENNVEDGKGSDSLPSHEDGGNDDLRLSLQSLSIKKTEKFKEDANCKKKGVVEEKQRSNQNDTSEQKEIKSSTIGSTKASKDGNLYTVEVKDGVSNTSEKEDSEQNMYDCSAPVKVEDINITFSSLDNYTSVFKFEDMGLKDEILHGIYDMGFQRPSKIQEKALPLLLADPPQNLIGQSQSGTGKTAAFVISSLSRVDYNSSTTQVLCVSPSRELARQTLSVFSGISKHIGISIALAVKDVDRYTTLHGRHVIVGTPGTIVRLLMHRAVDASNLKCFIVDEADHVLGEPNMGDQTMRIKRYVPRSCQTMFFSATYPRKLMEYALKLAPNAHKLSLREDELSVEGITQLYLVCNNYPHKYDVLSAIYGLLTVGQSIVFCQTRNTAEMVGQRLEKDGHICSVLHGTLPPEYRDRIIDKFRAGDVKVLISSNVISRGIDIEQVNVVINFDIPLDAGGKPDTETYLHRIGRTGRFGRSGISINFVHDKESLDEMNHIMNYFNRPITRIEAHSIPNLEAKLRQVLDIHT